MSRSPEALALGPRPTNPRSSSSATWSLSRSFKRWAASCRPPLVRVLLSFHGVLTNDGSLTTVRRDRSFYGLNVDGAKQQGKRDDPPGPAYRYAEREGEEFPVICELLFVFGAIGGKRTRSPAQLGAKRGLGKAHVFLSSALAPPPFMPYISGHQWVRSRLAKGLLQAQRDSRRSIGCLGG